MAEPAAESSSARRDSAEALPPPTGSENVAEPEAAGISLEVRVGELEGVCEALAERVQTLEGRLEKCESGLEENRRAIETLTGQAAAGESRESDESAASDWLIVEMWRDLRLLVRMFRDVHYRVAWTTTAISLAAILYLTVWPAARHWLGWGWNLPVLSYVDNLLVAYLGLKVLSRELRCYEHFLRKRRQR